LKGLYKKTKQPGVRPLGIKGRQALAKTKKKHRRQCHDGNRKKDTPGEKRQLYDFRKPTIEPGEQKTVNRKLVAAS